MEGGDASIHLNRFEEWPAARDCRRAARRAVRETLAAGRPGAGADGRSGPGTGDRVGEAEVSVTCLSAEEIREMNRRYLSRDVPTDVIAFDLGDGDRLLGDVYLSPEVAGRQAGERGVDPRREVLRLVIHGVLHVLGWEHPEGSEREGSEMYRRQEVLLDRVAGSPATPAAGESGAPAAGESGPRASDAADPGTGGGSS